MKVGLVDKDGRVDCLLCALAEDSKRRMREKDLIKHLRSAHERHLLTAEETASGSKVLHARRQDPVIWWSR